jgi:hypothetical protein
MKKRPFFLVSLLLVILAIFAHFIALYQYSQSAQLYARMATVAEAQRPSMKVEADRLFNRGAILGFLDMGLAVSSIVFLIIAFCRREPAWFLLPLGLLMLYVLIQFLVV